MAGFLNNSLLETMGSAAGSIASPAVTGTAISGLAAAGIWKLLKDNKSSNMLSNQQTQIPTQKGSIATLLSTLSPKDRVISRVGGNTYQKALLAATGDWILQLDADEVVTPVLAEEIKKVIAWYNLLYLEEPFEPWKLYWYGLTSQLDAKAFKKLTRDMGINSKMELQPKTGDRLLNSLFKFDGTNYQLYTLLRPYDTETLLYLMARAKTEKMRRLISFFFTKLKGEKALVDGKELLQMGLKSGPVFREVFDNLLEARLNNLTKTRDDEIRFVKNKFGDLFDESD